MTQQEMAKMVDEKLGYMSCLGDMVKYVSEQHAKYGSPPTAEMLVSEWAMPKLQQCREEANKLIARHNSLMQNK